jgi:hypothetical protein
MVKSGIIIALAVVGASAGAVALLTNSKQAKAKRVIKRTGRAMYTVGTMLRTLSGVEMSAN